MKHKEKLNWSLCEKRVFFLLICVIPGLLSGKRGTVRKKFHMINRIKENGKYVNTKRLAEDKEK